MVAFILHLLLTATLLLLVAHLISGIQVRGWGSAIVGALVLGIVNAIVRPILVLLTLPLTIVTLGLFLFIVNALSLWLAFALVPGIRVSGFGAALLGSLLLTVLNLLLAAIFGL